jgi:hypothetical protein
MLAPWLLYSLGTSALVAVAAIAAELLLAAWRWPRRGVWLAAIALAIGIPVCVASREPARTDARTASAPHTAGPRASVETVALLPRAIRAGGDRIVRTTSVASDLRVLQIWGACSASLLGFLLAGLVRLKRQTRTWGLTVIDGWDVLVAPDVGPAVVGFMRPRIVIPAWSLSLDASARSLILRHEREHIRARDAYLLLFAGFSVALFPWNVALWFMARRLVLAVELDCDQRVLRGTASVREYGLMLLEVGRRRDGRGLLLGASLIRPRRFLARRIHAMVTLERRRPRLSNLALITSIVVLTMAAARVPRPAPLRVSLVSTRAASSEIAHAVNATVNPMVPIAPARATAGRRTTPVALIRGEPKLRITADWENAPIELVVAAFARFSGRKISTAAGVSGLVTAHVNNQPWDEALSQVMALHGYRVVVYPDSSITIAPAPPSRSENRRVSGRVIDERTGLPIVGALVNVAGRQALGEPNRACSTNGGAFELMAPDGEAWLDASAAGYEFSRVTLAANETRALFVGRVSARGRALATIRNLNTQPQYASATHSTPIIVIDGVVTSPDHFDVGPCGDR